MMPAMRSGAWPVLRSVTSRVTPIAMNALPNPMRVADSSSAGKLFSTPVPVRFTVYGFASRSVRIVSVPARGPSALGWNVTSGEHVAPEAIVVQVSETSKSPAVLRSVMVATYGDVLRIVTACPLLRVPTGCDPKSTLAGTLSCGGSAMSPVPSTLIETVPPLVARVSTPWRRFGAVGRKTTAMRHDSPGSSVIGHAGGVLPAGVTIANSPVMPMPENVRGALPLLDTVTISCALSEPACWGGKPRGPGDAVPPAPA